MYMGTVTQGIIVLLGCLWFVSGFGKKMNNVTITTTTPGDVSDKGTAEPTNKTAPNCFKKFPSSGLAGFPFKSIKLKNNSPQSCADVCTTIHDDEDEPRTCHGFDFNTKTNACRFFEKTSKSGNAKMDVYELDEKCWEVQNGPPTLPPHVDACPQGSKPLMEKVSGWYLRTAGLGFKNVTEKECYGRCLQDKLPSRDENYKCLSVSYNSENNACVYLAEIASPLSRDGPSLKQDRRFKYYAKMCVSADTVKRCRGYVTRFTLRELVGMNDAKISTSSYPSCVTACLRAQETLGFECLSGMFYNNATVENCVLNYADHYAEPTLFINDPHNVVDYFSVKSCQW